MLKKHAGISSGFCTKNILFCTNPKKLCTKTWDSSGKNRRKYERKFSETPRNSTVRNRKMMKFYAKKGKSPLLCRELLRNPRKEQKQAHLNRTVKGCFYQFRHL